METRSDSAPGEPDLNRTGESRSRSDQVAASAETDENEKDRRGRAAGPGLRLRGGVPAMGAGRTSMTRIVVSSRIASPSPPSAAAFAFLT